MGDNHALRNDQVRTPLLRLPSGRTSRSKVHTDMLVPQGSMIFEDPEQRATDEGSKHGQEAVQDWFLEQNRREEKLEPAPTPMCSSVVDSPGYPSKESHRYAASSARYVQDGTAAVASTNSASCPGERTESARSTNGLQRKNSGISRVGSGLLRKSSSRKFKGVSSARSFISSCRSNRRDNDGDHDLTDWRLGARAAAGTNPSVRERLRMAVRSILLRKYRLRITRIDLTMLVLSVLSIVLMIAQHQLPRYHLLEDSDGRNEFARLGSLAAESVQSALTLLLLGLMLRYHWLFRRRLRIFETFLLMVETESMDGKGWARCVRRSAQMIVEGAVLAVHPFPGGVVPIQLELFMWLRLYTALRVARDLSTVNQSRDGGLSWNLAIKSWLYSRPTLAVGLSLLALLSSTAYGILLSEMHGSDEEMAGASSPQTAGEALWMVAITMTTVGFGDFTPRTFIARMPARKKRQHLLARRSRTLSDCRCHVWP